MGALADRFGSTPQWVWALERDTRIPTLKTANAFGVTLAKPLSKPAR